MWMRWPQPQISYVYQLKEFYKKTNLEVQTHKTYQAVIIEVEVSTFYTTIASKFAWLLDEISKFSEG